MQEITVNDLQRLQAFGCFPDADQPDYRNLPLNELEQVDRKSVV